MDQELMFTEPRPKGKHQGKAIPFPILPSNDLYFVDGEAPVFFGVFNGYCVVVSDPEDMKNLYSMGCFGKGSQSRSFPVLKEAPIQEATETNKVEQMPSESENKLVLEEKLSTITAEVEETKQDDSEPMDFKEEETPSDPPQPVITLEINTRGKTDTQICKKEHRFSDLPLDPVLEELHLSLEEAFFLSFGLDCLEVEDMEGNRLTFRDMWEKFRKAQSNFLVKYVVYHHFRSKGWVVRPGHRFGGDFLLYKKGPAYFHASFIVVVELVNDDYMREETITWSKVIAMNRLAMATGKDLLLCQVKGPRPINEIEDLELLSQFEVNEVLVRKWKE